MEILDHFFYRAREDPYIGPTHIALFVAIFQLGGYSKSLKAHGLELRKAAKIASSKTYYRLLKDLYNRHYIEYERGRHRWEKNQIRFVSEE